MYSIKSEDIRFKILGIYGRRIDFEIRTEVFLPYFGALCKGSVKKAATIQFRNIIVLVADSGMFREEVYDLGILVFYFAVFCLCYAACEILVPWVRD